MTKLLKIFVFIAICILLVKATEQKLDPIEQTEMEVEGDAVVRGEKSFKFHLNIVFEAILN